MVSEINEKIVVHNGKKSFVSEEAKGSTGAALRLIKENTNHKFFDEIDVHLVSNIKDLKIFNYYSAVVKGYSKPFSGLFIPSDTDVYINENEVLKNTKNIKNTYIDFNSKIQNIVIHEVGHFFDEYYGCKINNYEEVLDLIESDKISKKEREALLNKVLNNDTLSDQEVFKEALIKDLSALSIEELRNLMGDDVICKNCDIKDCVNETDSLRAEVFANLFSLVLGADYENRVMHLLVFRETIKVVSDFITQMKNQEQSCLEKFDIVI